MAASIGNASWTEPGEGEHRINKRSRTSRGFSTKNNAFFTGVPMPKPIPPLEREEAIRILEDIARTSNNAAARIAAIKQLEAMRDGAPAEAATGFAALDG